MVVRISRIAYQVLAWLFAACLFVQVYFAGRAVFDDGDWSAHTSFIHVFEFAPVLMLVCALVGRLGWKTAVLSAGLFVLIIFQYISAHLDNKAVAAVHPVTALLLIWGTVIAIRRSRQA